MELAAQLSMTAKYVKNFILANWDKTIVFFDTPFSSPDQHDWNLLTVLQAFQNPPQCTSDYCNLGCDRGSFQTLQDHLKPTPAKPAAIKTRNGKKKVQRRFPGLL